MTLRQLEYLVAVIDEGSFGRAALALYVSQPTLSSQVRALENEIGGPLLERLPRGVRPTATGEAMLPAARAALAAAARARRAARMVLGLEAGELEIATVGAVALGMLPPVLRRWRARHPARTVRINEHRDGVTLADAVAGGGPDLGIGPRPPEWTGTIETLGWEEFVVVLPPGDPLRDTEGPIDLARMATRDWVLFERDHGLGWIIEAICATAGFTPSAAVRTAQISGAPALAAAGLGPALVPLNIVPGPQRRWARRLDPPRARELCAFTRDDWPPLARAFLDLIAERPWPDRPPDATPVHVIRR
jgi:DNA-binding transcriptional LysR family regulator